MNPRSLKIFEKKKGIYISPENIVAISWTIIIFLIYYLKSTYEFNFKGWETGILIFGTIYIIGLMISTFFRYEREIGEYRGRITFYENRVEIENNVFDRLRGLLLANKAVEGPKGFKKDQKIDSDTLSSFTLGQCWQFVVSSEKIMLEVETLKNEFDNEIKRLQVRFEEKVDKIQDGDELLPGVLKMVKVFVAVKRKLQPGDKMAGRHGT
jgi:hypothetical protein